MREINEELKGSVQSTVRLTGTKSLSQEGGVGRIVV